MTRMTLLFAWNEGVRSEIMVHALLRVCPKRPRGRELSTSRGGVRSEMGHGRGALEMQALGLFPDLRMFCLLRLHRVHAAEFHRAWVDAPMV